MLVSFSWLGRIMSALGIDFDTRVNRDMMRTKHPCRFLTFSCMSHCDGLTSGDTDMVFCCFHTEHDSRPDY